MKRARAAPAAKRAEPPGAWHESGVGNWGVMCESSIAIGPAASAAGRGQMGKALARNRCRRGRTRSTVVAWRIFVADWPPKMPSTWGKVIPLQARVVWSGPGAEQSRQEPTSSKSHLSLMIFADCAHQSYWASFGCPANYRQMLGTIHRLQRRAVPVCTPSVLAPTEHWEIVGVPKRTRRQHVHTCRSRCNSSMPWPHFPRGRGHSGPDIFIVESAAVQERGLLSQACHSLHVRRARNSC